MTARIAISLFALVTVSTVSADDQTVANAPITAVQPAPTQEDHVEPQADQQAEYRGVAQGGEVSGILRDQQDVPLMRKGSASLPVPLGGRISSPVPWYRSGFVALTLVLATIGLIVYLVKRFVPATKTLNSGVLEVVARTYLAPKQFLALVRMGKQLVLVGVTGESINSLTVVDDPEQVTMLLGEAERKKKGSISSGFHKRLEIEGREYADANLPSEIGLETSGDSLADTRSQLRKLMGNMRRMGKKGISPIISPISNAES